jgi:RHS repeat-associated protein
MSTPAGTYTYSYDAAGRLVGLSALGWSASWTYAPNGWLLTQTLNGASTTYEYNARSFLTRLTNRDVGGNVLSDFQNLRYDGVGNRTQMTVSFPAMPSLGGVTNYSYDTKNQLLQEQSTRVGGYTFTFAYDPAQNPTQFKGQSRTYNANNQLIGAGFAYDGNGNPVLYKGVNLSFDPENRMTAYGNILTASYNGDGLRAWKQTASGRRYYLYDGEELVCELDAAGNPVAGVVFGANGLVVYDIRAYQFDPQGNAVHLMDDDGLVLAHLAYDAWGQRMSGENPTPYGYKGQWGYYTDAETGLLLLTHRYYDPATGRFLTRDPIGAEGGVNLYAYTRNRPVMLRDSRGTFAWVPAICAACAVCLAGFVASCWDCGFDASCWSNCVSGIWENLPLWTKVLCGGACIGCAGMVIKPGPVPEPHPLPVPPPPGNPAPNPSPQPDCPGNGRDGHDPERFRLVCIGLCEALCSRNSGIAYFQCFDRCFLDCVRNIGPGPDYRPYEPFAIY